MSEKSLNLECLNKEIEELTKSLVEKDKVIQQLHQGIEQTNNDRNTIFGALQQSNRLKTMLLEPEKVEPEKVELKIEKKQ